MAELLFGTTLNYKIKINYNDFPPCMEKLFFEKSGIMIDEISFSSMDLLCDIITYGIPQFWVSWKHHMKRYLELQYKYYLTTTALEIDDKGYVIVSDNIKYLDSSERNFIAYYIGMFITKLVSREIFGCEYLVHFGIVSKYKKIIRSTKEPDLVGFTGKNDDYILFEAKGRKFLKKALIDTAKKQIQSVKYISGIKPITGVVCVTHPIKETERLICSMYDPIPNEGTAIYINKGELLYLYYLPIYELIKEMGDNEPQCNIYFDKNINDRIECNIKMSKSLFDLFTEYPIFNKLDNIFFTEIENITLNSFDETKEDLLNIELL